MAISVGESVGVSFHVHLNYPLLAVFVGNAQSWVPELVERAKGLKVNGGFEQGADL